MNRPLRALIGLAAGAFLATSAAVAVAQDQAGPQPHAAMAEKWREHMREHEEAHIRAMHDILSIRPDQDAAFQAFVASMRPPEHGDHKGMEGGPDEMAHLTTPQRLDRMAARMAEHQAAFERHAAAVKTFYAVLSPQQQRAFDALAEMHHFHDGHGMGGMGDHGPMGHGGPGEGPPPPGE